MDNVNAAADRSQEVRALWGVITSELTELLADVERVRSLERAPAGVDRFVATAEERLVVLLGRARDEDGRRTIVQLPDPGTDRPRAQVDSEGRYRRS